MKRIQAAFSKQETLLSFFYTAGFPELNDTIEIAQSLEHAGADMIELGFPYSDPLADGPTIQRSNERAISNGMNLELLFEQLSDLRPRVSIPVLLMGYLNPVMLYGVERFIKQAKEVGIDGLIIPDLPLEIYQREFLPHLVEHDLGFAFLVTPNSSEERIKVLDQNSRGFLYAVSSHAVTGATLEVDSKRQQYFKRLVDLKLKNPIMLGFGITDRKSAAEAGKYVSGVIVGSAFIRALETARDVQPVVADFVAQFIEE